MNRSAILFAAAAASALSGCSFSLIGPPSGPAPKAPPPPVAKCPEWPALPAIPHTVHISIDGDDWTMDRGGEALLRAYVEARDRWPVAGGR